MVNACCVGSASRSISASYWAASANRPSWARLMTSQSDRRPMAAWEARKTRRPSRRAAPRGCRWPARPPARTRPGSNAPARDRSWPGCGALRSPRRPAISSARVPVASASSSSPSSEWRCVMNAQTRPRRRSSFNRSARASASRRRSSARRTSPSWISTGRSSRRISKPCSSVDWLSGSASRTPSACSNQTRASGSADRAAAL